MRNKLSALLIILPVISSPAALASNSVTVFAASSLTDSYTQLGKQFEAAHPGITVKFSFLASSTLATQLRQ
jgi:molybdate transport system substrate-binding protein